MQEKDASDGKKDASEEKRACVCPICLWLLTPDTNEGALFSSFSVFSNPILNDVSLFIRLPQHGTE